MDERTPKYLNHPTHAGDENSAALYGLDAAARQAIARGVPVTLLEGAAELEAVRATGADVVPLAPCGTAVTEAQLQELRTLHPNAVASMVVGPDADTAGRRGGGARPARAGAAGSAGAGGRRGRARLGAVAGRSHGCPPLDQLTDQIERGEQAWAGCAGASGRVGARALSLVGVASEWR